jgi:hypothetical protein
MNEHLYFTSDMTIVYIPVPQYNYTIENDFAPPLLTRIINGVEMTTKQALERQSEIINNGFLKKLMNKSKL